MGIITAAYPEFTVFTRFRLRVHTQCLLWFRKFYKKNADLQQYLLIHDWFFPGNYDRRFLYTLFLFEVGIFQGFYTLLMHHKPFLIENAYKSLMSIKDIS